MTDKLLEKTKILYELCGQRNALINTNTDIWEKIEIIQSKILKLQPIKKKNHNSNVY